MQVCLNCGMQLTDHYCAHCGQKAEVSRLTWHSLVEEVFHFFTHIEKGFFKTAGTLIIRPGKLFKDYLDGKRKTYHKPVSFLMIWIAAFLIIFGLANKFTHYASINSESLVTFDARTWMIINKYRTLIEVLILPVTAFITWLVVARPRLNYIEIVSVSFYIVSLLFIVLCIQMVIALIFQLNYRTNTFDLVSVIVYLIWILYCGIDFYRRYKVRWLVVRVIFSVALNVVAYFLLSRLIAKGLLALGFA